MNFKLGQGSKWTVPKFRIEGDHAIFGPFSSKVEQWNWWSIGTEPPSSLGDDLKPLVSELQDLALYVDNVPSDEFRVPLAAIFQLESADAIENLLKIKLMRASKTAFLLNCDGPMKSLRARPMLKDSIGKLISPTTSRYYAEASTGLLFVFDSHLVRLFELSSSFINDVNTNVQVWAKIQKLKSKCREFRVTGAPDRDEWYTPGSVDLDIQMDQGKVSVGVQITDPNTPGLNEAQSKLTAAGLTDAGFINIKSEQGKTIRLAFDSEKVAFTKTVQSLPVPHTNDEIQKMFNSPLDYLEERGINTQVATVASSISGGKPQDFAELFSERVISLRAKLEATEFQIQTPSGKISFSEFLQLPPSSARPIPQSLTDFQENKELEQALFKAWRVEKKYLRWNADWIEIDYDYWGHVTKEKFGLEIVGNLHELEHENRNLPGSGFIFPDPKGLLTQFKSFQREGFHWLASHLKTGTGALLADDMGLGKTLQAISLLGHLHEGSESYSVLIACPKTVIGNWVREIEKHFPSLASSVVVHLGMDRRKNKTFSPKSIVLSTYDTIRRDAFLLGIDWDLIICDECQNIKAETSSRTRVFKGLKAFSRVGLTGTPVENGLKDLWNHFDFVQAGLLSSLSDFEVKFVGPITREGDEAKILALHEKIKPHFKRRLKENVLDWSIEKTQYNYKLDSSILQKEILDKMKKDLERDPRQGVLFSIFSPMLQVCVDPLLGDPNFNPLACSESELLATTSRSPKMAWLENTCNAILEQKEQVLVFSTYRKVSALVKRFLEVRFKIAIPPSLDGNTTAANRSRIVDQFQNSRYPILILSPRAAGTGLTLTKASHVIHITRQWNPALENQCTDRAYRIGQDKNVHVHHPFVKSTIDEFLHIRLVEKLKLIHDVIFAYKEDSPAVLMEDLLGIKLPTNSIADSESVKTMIKIFGEDFIVERLDDSEGNEICEVIRWPDKMILIIPEIAMEAAKSTIEKFESEGYEVKSVS